MSAKVSFRRLPIKEEKMIKNSDLKHYRKAAIDQILVWFFLLIIFAQIFFFVIEYSTAVRVKENISFLADYGARMAAFGKTSDEIATGMNNIKIDSIQTITAGNISCSNTSNNNFQVTFTVSTTYVSGFISNNTISQKSAALNEINSDQVDCTLTVTLTQ